MIVGCEVEFVVSLLSGVILLFWAWVCLLDLGKSTVPEVSCHRMVRFQKDLFFLKSGVPIPTGDASALE